MGKKLFITGAGGYLGSVLATRLAGLPEIDSITGLINNTIPSTPLPDKVKLVKMDVRSPELTAAMAGHDFVIHAAFIVQWLKKMPAAVRDDINFNGTRNVAQAAVRNRVSGFLHASSLAAYNPVQAHGKENIDEGFPIGKGDSPMYYWNSKAITEKILSETLAASGTTLTLFRIGYIIGPLNRATVPGFRENAVLFPGLDPRAQFSHEDDVVQAFALAIYKKISGAFNVAPDDSIRLSEVYEIIGRKTIDRPRVACAFDHVHPLELFSFIHPFLVGSRNLGGFFSQQCKIESRRLDAPVQHLRRSDSHGGIKSNTERMLS